MARVRLLQTTYHTEVEPHRLVQGHAFDVDQETAARWVRNRIAEDWDGPLGFTDDETAHATADELAAEMARLEELLAAKRAAHANQLRGHPLDQAIPPAAEEPNPVAAAYRTDVDPLARYDLTAKQRADLVRAGFTRPEIIDAASLEDLQEVEGVGPATLAKLRPDLAGKR